MNIPGFVFIRVRQCIAIIVLAMSSTGVNAAFLQIQENSASGLGNAFAGGSAIAEDASTVWYNPAGMTYLKEPQLVVAAHLIKPSIEFNKTSANLSPVLGGAAISGGEGGDAGDDAVVPNIYYSQSLSDNLFMGFGLNAPYGLVTEYDDAWVGRYHAIRSAIQTINMNAALGYRWNEQFSVGGGINYQTLDAELTQAVDYGSLCALAAVGACAAPGANDGKGKVTADGDAFGFNLGALWQPFESTRFGLSYRSKMKFDLDGEVEYSAPSPLAAAVAQGVAGIRNAGATTDVTLPATLSVSAVQQLTPTLTLMEDITRTYWDDLQELRIGFDSGQADSVTTLGLQNINRYSIGLIYRPLAAWVFRTGIALDESPTPGNALRSVRLPDNDREWLTLGVDYEASDRLSIGLSYASIHANESHLVKNAGTDPSGENFLRGSLSGSVDASVQILSLQAKLIF